jgi:hypothetical protein
MVEFKITYDHAEAYCHMHYECRAGHVTEIWNSRDGVTPFMLQCLHPECGEIAQHVRWNEDLVDPTYQLQPGDWYFRNGHADDAERILRRRFDGKPLDVDFLVRLGVNSAEDLIQKILQDPENEFRPGWPYLDRWPFVNTSSDNTD